MGRVGLKVKILDVTATSGRNLSNYRNSKNGRKSRLQRLWVAFFVARGFACTTNWWASCLKMNFTKEIKAAKYVSPYCVINVSVCDFVVDG